MKRNDLFILLSTACYSFLFYEQLAGFNFLIFSVILTAILFFRTENRWQNKGFIATAIGTVITGLAIWLYGTNIAIVCNILSLMLMSAFSLNAENSLIINLFHSMYSYLSVLIFMLIDTVNKINKPNLETSEVKKPNIFQKILLVTIPGLISLIFFLLYRSSNDAFKELTNKINLDFISLPFLFFTLSGFILMYAFYLQRSIRQIKEYDANKTNILNADLVLQNPDWFTKSISANMELISGIILFAMLNILLATVNATDILYVWTKHQLPEHVSYSKFVHNGIGALITSIIFAISIILFYFRGAINFDSKNKSIKYLAYAWMLQNMFMIVSTMMRNKMYVEQYSLTEKRIGVFIYLLLAVIGLCFTLYKVATQKNNIFLFRVNSWACYIVIIICASINWSPLITSYNIHKSKTVKHFALDIDYLGNLSYNNLKPLLNYYSENQFSNPYLKSKIDDKIIDILTKYHQKDWRSMVMARTQLYQYILELNQQHKIPILQAANKGLTDLAMLNPLTNLESLDLGYNHITHLQEFENFKNLKTLNLSNNQIYSVDTLALMPKLESLDLSSNMINKYDIANKTPQLKELNLSRNYLDRIDGIGKIKSLESLDLSYTTIKDISLLTNLPQLKKLNFQSNQVTRIPSIPSLQALDISLSSSTEGHYENWIDTKTLENLIELNATNTSLIHTGILTNEPLRKHLKILNLTNNAFKNLNELVNYESLQSLDISGNNLLMLDSLPNLSSLETLTAQQTTFESFNFLNQFPRLNSLDISNSTCALSIDSLFNESLQSLDIDNCNIKYISNKVCFKNLVQLSLEGCEINDISFIRNSKKLESLSLSSIDDKNINDILSLANLKSIKTYSISDELYQRLMTAKPDLIINRYTTENRYTISD